MEKLVRFDEVPVGYQCKIDGYLGTKIDEETVEIKTLFFTRRERMVPFRMVRYNDASPSYIAQDMRIRG